MNLRSPSTIRSWEGPFSTSNCMLASSSTRYSRPVGEPVLSRGARRASGVYYTPPEIVELVLDLVLSGSGLRVLDMACGAGEFLVQALCRMQKSAGNGAAREAICGWDIDPQAIATAYDRLSHIDREFPREALQVEDALQPDCGAPASFDVIVGNPPYLSIRQIAKSYSEEQVARLRARFLTARGNFDIYVLFIERALQLLRPGGRCGLVVPNKWATLEYARPCREMLLSEASIEHVVDLSDCKAFATANVYPHILVFQKRAAVPEHGIRIWNSDSELSHTIKQNSISATAIQLQNTLPIESRVATVPLGTIARLACGTTGYAACRIARRLVEADEEPVSAVKAADFVTTSNIDRYAIRLGDVRFLKRYYARPRLPLDAPELTERTRRLFTEPKIIIAGMSRRLEAAWDECGRALGVQVFAAYDCEVSPFFLLALLNSKLLSYLFATRFAGKQLSGGYLSINKGQLTTLPIRQCQSAAERRVADKLAQLASHWTPACDDEIDQLIYRLYRLREAELEWIEGHFKPVAFAAA